MYLALAIEYAQILNTNNLTTRLSQANTLQELGEVITRVADEETFKIQDEALTSL